MNIWIDEHIPAPQDYVWCKSIDEAKNEITEIWKNFRETLEKLEDKNTASKELFEDLKISISSVGPHEAIQHNELSRWLQEKGFGVRSLFDAENFRQILLAK